MRLRRRHRGRDRHRPARRRRRGGAARPRRAPGGRRRRRRRRRSSTRPRSPARSCPSRSGPGARVHAGSVVLRGRLVVRATAVGNDTAIGRIITRVEQAQHDRAPIQTVGEKFSRRFVPASFALAGLTLLVTRDVRRAMTMLLVACPCAVGPVHADRDQRGDRQRRAARHADQGRIAPGGGRPGRRDRVRQDRHPDPRPARRHQRRVVPRGLGTRAGARLRRELARSTRDIRWPGRDPLDRGTPHRDPAARGVRGARSGWACGSRPTGGRCSSAARAAAQEGVPIEPDARPTGCSGCSAPAETPLLLAVDGELVGLISCATRSARSRASVLDALRANGVRRIVHADRRPPGDRRAPSPPSWASPSGGPRCCPRRSWTWSARCRRPGTSSPWSATA